MKWIWALWILLAIGMLTACTHSRQPRPQPDDVVTVTLEYPENRLHPGNLPWYRVADNAIKGCQEKGFDYALGTDHYTERCKYHFGFKRRGRGDFCSLYEYERVYQCKFN